MGRPKRKQGGPVYFREWRAESGLNQQQAAERAGLSQETISRLETGKVDYSKANLEALAFAYGCEPGDLLRPPKPPKNELAAYVMKLDAQQQNRAIRMLKSAFEDEPSDAPKAAKKA